MPWAPAKGCIEPRCPNRASGAGSARCAEHQSARRAAQDATRASARARGYDKAWERVRAAFLAAHPRCGQCGAPAVDVDHVRAISDGGARLDPANLRPFCHKCHSARTGRDQGGFSAKKARLKGGGGKIGPLV